jgi:hypothetical protein
METAGSPSSTPAHKPGLQCDSIGQSKPCRRNRKAYNAETARKNRIVEFAGVESVKSNVPLADVVLVDTGDQLVRFVDT